MCYRTADLRKNRPKDYDSSLFVAGWREWVALPELGIPAIKAKLDTGARTSSLHTFHLEPFMDKGRHMVRFGLHPLQRRKDVEVFCTTEILDQRMTSDSGGKRELRWVIGTSISFGGMTWPIEVNLTNREDMRFRFLLGRTAMEGRIIVNPCRSYADGKGLARQYGQRRSGIKVKGA
jgi:hypothetical protein